MAGATRRLAREQLERAWLAYHTAILPLLKTKPTFDEFSRPWRERRPKTWQEMAAAMDQVAAYQKGRNGEV